MFTTHFKYVRIQGKELARNTMYAKGIFSMGIHPYYLVYTNFPGEIVYEDKYQVAAKTDGILQIDDVPESWAPSD